MARKGNRKQVAAARECMVHHKQVAVAREYNRMAARGKNPETVDTEAL